MKSTVDEIRQRFDADVERFSYTLKLLERLPNLDATLIDLSQPMLDRARERVSRATIGRITTIQGDIREIELAEGQFDIIVAAGVLHHVLHHLRTDQEWQEVFTAFHRALPPGGSVWVFDLVESSIPAVGRLMRRQYRRISDPAEGRSLPGSCVHLRREGRHATPAVVSTGHAPSGWLRSGRSSAQECLLRCIRCCEGLKVSAAAQQRQAICQLSTFTFPTSRH